MTTRTTSRKKNSPAKRSRPEPLDVFVSHSSGDAPIALALIELLRAALDIPAERIRCTSVDGYRLPAAASIDDQLRNEIFNAKSFIALITRSSLQSTYVLFELGARWGVGQHLSPVLAAGIVPSELHAPLTSINAVSCENQAQIFQLVGDIGDSLEKHAGNPASYQRHVDNLIEVSESAVRDTSEVVLGSLAEPSIFCSRTTDYVLDEFQADVDIIKDIFGSNYVTPEQRLTAINLRDRLTSRKFNVLQITCDFDAKKKGNAIWSGGGEVTADKFARLVERSGASLVVFPYENGLYLAARIARITNIISSYSDNDPEEFLAWERAFYGGLAAGQKLSVAFESAMRTAAVGMALFLKNDFFFAAKK
jgi:hypothetical protein